jgi:diguanylate cyclase (GGDEF)-like protein/PAS domain S-box-containing protein
MRQATDSSMARYFECAPGLFFTLRLESDGRMAMPFLAGRIASLPVLTPEAMAEDIKPLLALCHPDDTAPLLAELHRSGRDMTPCCIEFRIEDPALGQMAMELKASPHRNENHPQAVEWSGFMHDITARKRAEIVQHGRDPFLASLLDTLPVPAFYKDSKDRYLCFVTAFETFTGTTTEQPIGRSVSDGHQRELAELYHAKNAAPLEQSGIQQHEFMAMNAQELGSEAVFGEAVFTDRQNIPAAPVGAIQDIAERKRMEEALAAREQTFRSLAESSPDYIVRYDCDGRCTYMNTALLRHLSLASNEEVIGKRPSERWPDGRFDGIEQAAAQAVASGAVTTIELCEPTAGEPLFHQILIVPERDTGGQIIGAIAFGRDITTIRATERHLAHFIDNLPGMAYTFRLGPDGHASFPFVSHAIKEIYGLDPEDVKDDFMPLHMLAHPEDRPRIDAVIAESARTMTPFRVESRVCRPGQHERWLDVRSVPERGADGSIIWYGLMLDITERKRIEAALAAREREFRSLVENSPDTVARYGRDLRRLYVNPAFAALVEGGAVALIGKTPSESPGGPNAAIYEQNLSEVFASTEARKFELQWTNKDGNEFCSLINLTPEFGENGTVESVLAVGRDITELNTFRKKIRQMAFYDSLTALPNRALFGDRLRQMIADASRHGRVAGVMMVDMDRFKEVNDTMGHAVGDELLRETATRLSACIRACDTVARLGGDEFAILLPEIHNSDDLGRIAGKIRGKFDERFLLGGKELFVSCSIGIAQYPNDSTEADDLVKYADSAMYFAKRSGRNNFRFYSKELTASARERLMLESELRRAVERKELELHYQPKILLRNGMLIGSEALLRWHHPQLGMVSPNQFIQVAEDTGLIVDLGKWVLHEACRTASEWNAEGNPLHKVAINLSARQFQPDDLVMMVADILNETACRPEWIELEITESLLLDEDGKTLKMLSGLRTMGVTIAIDDFGTGFSALSYLTRFPIDTLKIDRSFIHSVASDHYRAELVKAILSIARCLGQQVVAEGVETVEQAAFLDAYGCQVAQGFLYSRPLPKIEAASLPRYFNRANPVMHGGLRG